MAKIDRHQIDRLLKLDRTEVLSDGEPGLRFTAHYRGAPTTSDRQAWTLHLQDWQRRLSADLHDVGVEPVTDSLSIAGQTMEVIVPIKRLEDVLKTLEARDVEVTLQRERTVDPEF